MFRSTVPMRVPILALGVAAAGSSGVAHAAADEYRFEALDLQVRPGREPNQYACGSCASPTDIR
jgi:hypothetical protein